MESKVIYRYPGSRPFEDTDIDRKLFFGRDREKEELLQKIMARKLVVLHAESGLGKTSLLNAGLSQLLRERGFLPIKIRFNRPETRPVQTIFNDIKETTKQHNLDIEPGETETLWHYFKTAAFWSHDDSLLTPVLIFDQFEEFFAFHEPEARAEFISQLADLVHNTIPQGLRLAIRTGEPYRYGEEPPRVKFVISIRSDFVGQLDELSSTVPEILDNRYRLSALTRCQAREAITGPAQIQDENMFSRRFRYSEDALNMMLDYLSKRRERGGVVNKDEVESFQLQLLCRHVETNILEKAGKTGAQDELEVKKEALGGAAGMHKVFQNFYKKQLAGLKSALNKRRVRRLCEKGLISPSNRRLSLEEEVIEKKFKVSPAVLTQLVDNRLLRAEKRVGSVYYELSHDTLIVPIRLCQRRHWATNVTVALFFAVQLFIIIVALGSFAKLNTLFKEAEQLTFEKKNDQAIVKYSEILDEDYKNIMAIVKLGELLLEGGKYETAIQLYKEAINNGITDTRVFTGLGRVLFKIGKEEEAIIYLNEAIKLNPGQTDAYETFGDHYANKKEFKIAVENYEKVLAIDKKNKGVYKKLAVLYVETGEKEKAIDVFKRAVKVDPKFARIYEKIRDVLLLQNDTETLETLYGIAFQAKIQNAYHYSELGNDYYELKKYEAALTSYRKAVEIKPDFDVVYTIMGLLQYNKGDYDAAIASFRKALELKPADAEIYNNMGIAQSNKGDYDAALDSYRKVLELKPNNANTYYNMGIVQYNKADYNAAIASFKKALELKPDFAMAYYNMGIMKGNKGDYNIAIASFKKVLELKPDDADAHYNMGIAYRIKGDYNAAIDSYHKALEIKPAFLSAKENIAELYLITERFEKAMENAKVVLREDNILIGKILTMKSIVISSLFCQRHQNEALKELQQLIAYYRDLTNDFERGWDYSPTKKYIAQTQRLNEPTRALLLKMFDLLEAPKREGDKILVELEKMAREYK